MEVPIVQAVLNQGMGGYSEVHGFDSSNI